jgi:hypothetical protein
MPVHDAVALLRAERDKLDRAIQILEGGVKRRGRPPKNSYDDPTMPDWVKPKSALVAPKKHGRKFTAAQGKAQATRMKAFWAAKKKG